MDTLANIHTQLKHSMKKEIEIMRELLSNLHREELSLLMQDRKEWVDVMQQRSDLIIQLGSVRKERTVATKNLEKIAPQQMLPLQEISSSEILTLLDQLFALVDRLNLQNCRNDALFYQSKALDKIPMHCNYPHPKTQTAKRKTRVALYPPKDVE